MSELKLTDKEKMFLTAIAVEAVLNGLVKVEDYVNDNYSWISRKEIAKKTGFSKQQIAGLTARLHDKKIIVIDYADDTNPFASAFDREDLYCLSTEWLESLEQDRNLLEIIMNA